MADVVEQEVFGVSVDIGTGNIVGARKTGGKVTFTRVRDAFIDLPVENKRMLKMSNTSFVEMDGRLIVVGDEAIETANLLNCEARRPMAGGVISAGEFDAQQIMALIMKKVLGDPQTPGEKCCYSVPAVAIDVPGSNITYHTAILKKVLLELGFTPEPANEALAVVLSECAKEQFRAIGLSYGTGLTNICLGYNAMAAIEFSLGRGGDFIDTNAAKAVGTTAAKICSIKESGIDITKPNPNSREEEAISVYYTNLIDYTIDKMVETFASKKNEIHVQKPIPIVVAGGTSLAVGFMAKFRERFELKRSKMPIQISEIRAAVNPLMSVAQGLLLLSHMDSD